MMDQETGAPAARKAAEWGSRTQVEMLVLLVVTALGLYLCARLAAPFVPAIAWALALAVLFAPLQRRLEGWVHRPNLAGAIAVLAIVLMVVVPAALVGHQLALQAGYGAHLVVTAVSSGEWRAPLDREPRLAALADRVEAQLDLPGTVASVVSWLSETAGSIVRGSVFQLLGVCLTFYLLFFFLRDRHAVLRGLRALSPLSKVEMDLMFGRLSDTIHATVYGTLAVSAAQGMLGGLMFWWLGLPAPLLWGAVMAVLAVIPVMGAFIVWVPAAIYLALVGSWGKALILALWGMLVVGTVDNLLRPVLVGRRLQQHTILAFMSVVGGLVLFGAAGLILGPLAVTITTVLLEVWRQRAAQTDKGATLEPLLEPLTDPDGPPAASA